ncbi:MAG: DUF5717 family protein, partial [Lachnospiraceae bacterium]|nr:DUF5717 family protein [Lachnospiraceae bacterium]
MNTNSRKLRVRLTQLYMDMRLRKVSRLDWMRESEEIVGKLLEEPDTDISAQLFYVQLGIMRRDTESVENLLDECSVWLLDYSDRFPLCHAYYLYLTTLMQDDPAYDEKVAGKLKELSLKYPALWQISWFYYYLNKENMVDAAEQYHFLKGMFIRGCRSPLLYLEARSLIERNPAFVYETSEFEEHLLIFMLRHTGVSISLAGIVSEYMSTLNFYRPLYLPLLKGMYEVAPGRLLLEAICRQGILGSHREPGMTVWYRRAIDEGLNQNGLYEIYLESLPVESWQMDGEELSAERAIPMTVLQYFAHSSPTDEVRCAYLYALVHKYRARWLNLYKEYEPLIQPFMMEQFRKGKVNAGLCYLYTNFLVSPMLSSDQGELLADICYSCCVEGLPLWEGTAIVEYEDYWQEIRAGIKNRSAILPLYGSRYELWAEDSFGRRYPCEDAVITPMMDQTGWAAWLNDNASEYGLYQMAVAEETKDENLGSLLPGILHLFEDPLVTEEYKRAFAARIVPVLEKEKRGEEIESVMALIFDDSDEGQAQELSFWQTLYREETIGVQGMEYLMNHWDATLLEKGILFTRARAISADTSDFAGRLIGQMTQEQYILTNTEEILTAYEGDDISLLSEFLEFSGLQGCLKKEPVGPVQLSLITELAQETEFSSVVRISFLESILRAGLGRQKEEVLTLARSWLEKFYRDGVYLSWFKSLHTLFEAILEKEAYQVLEYRGLADGPVWVRCRLLQGIEQEPEKEESFPMEKICEGLYARQFLLFYNERLQYEVYTLEGSEEVLLKQGVEQGGADFNGQGSRFGRINQMLAEREMRENEKLYHALEDYFKMDA